MTSKFLESDVVDSKIFAGRVLTILGQLDTRLRNIEEYLEETFPTNAYTKRDRLSRETQSNDVEDDRDIYDYEDEG